MSPGPAPRSQGPSKCLEACWHSQTWGPILWQARRTASLGWGRVPRGAGPCLGLGFHWWFGAVSCSVISRGDGSVEGPRRLGEAPGKLSRSRMAPVSLCGYLCFGATAGKGGCALPLTLPYVHMREQGRRAAVAGPRQHRQSHSCRNGEENPSQAPNPHARVIRGPKLSFLQPQIRHLNPGT